MVVTDVLSESPADKVGIVVGDVIKGVNHRPIENLSDFQVVMAKVEPGDTVLLRIRHGSWTIFVTIETAEQDLE